MTVRLLAAWGIYPANAIISIDSATETGLVVAKLADTVLTGGVAYVAPVDKTDYDQLAKLRIDPLTGAVTGLVGPGGDFALRTTRPVHRVIRGFDTLTGVTNTPTGGTVTASIDTASPFGGRALKLAFDGAATLNDTVISGFDLANFTAGRAKIVILAMFEEPRAVSQIQYYAGTNTGFTTSIMGYHNLANSGIHMSHGVHAITIIPETASSNNLATTDSVTALRIRCARSATPIANGVQDLPGGVAASTYATSVWIKGVYLVAETKPFVILTFDDAARSWTTLLQPQLASRGLKATFGINKTDVGTNDGLYINEADVNTLYAYGHDISSHNQTNTAYSIATEAAYIAEYRVCRDWHANAGRTKRLDYHPFVQGKSNPPLCAALASEGVKYARSVNDRNFERPLYDYGLHLQMPSRSLGSGTALATAQGWITQAETRQQDVVVMGHNFATAASDSVTWAISDMVTFLDFCLAEKAAGRIAGIGSLTEYEQYVRLGAYQAL